jgi:hypothetical protein
VKHQLKILKLLLTFWCPTLSHASYCFNYGQGPRKVEVARASLDLCKALPLNTAPERTETCISFHVIFFMFPLLIFLLQYLRIALRRKHSVLFRTQNCGHQRPYCSSSGWYMSMESHGGIILTVENRRIRRKTCPRVSLSTTNSTQARNRASATRHQRLTAWAITQLTHYVTMA